VLEGLNTLAVTNEVIQFAAKLINEKAIPETELRDAYHVSCAYIHGINYLLTWNCKHLAHAQRRERIQQLGTTWGYLSPILCTPEELLGD
jgi:predicted nucleic acid-binding protein